LHADNTTFDSNEIAYNGREQKVGQSANVTFRNNFVHHNAGDGIWYDSNANAGASHRRQPRGGQRTQRDFLRGQQSAPPSATTPYGAIRGTR
jgi:hypothetical protein